MNKIQIFPSTEEAITHLTDFFISIAVEQIDQKGIFSVALSGGRTPLALYKYLAQDSSADHLSWNKIHFFWGDERPVSPDHPDSNFLQASLTLLKPRLIPAENIHRIPGELDPKTAAAHYQKEILGWFANTPPRFDLVLLGMGTDGHTASLFPGTQALLESRQNEWVIANHVPQHSTWRITFTPKLINAAEQVVFLVTGQSKSESLFEV
ncbi:MAG: 6-phosphogluconolactonase, partial [Anaerolineales bacterium]|nr:6-phosphogluconolactonase [Anaerolineales bacterium]